MTSSTASDRRPQGPGRYIILALLLAGVVVMFYPLAWMFSSSLKPENEIFRNLSLIPETLTRLRPLNSTCPRKPRSP